MRQELAHRGLVALDGPDVTNGEIWTSGDTAVAFERDSNQVVATMRGVTRSVTDDGRLRIRGLVDGQTAEWTAADPERHRGSWVGVTVHMPDGDPLVNAVVTWSNYRVIVTPASGEGALSIPGATVQAVGGKRYVVAGETRVLVEQRRGCGCGG